MWGEKTQRIEALERELNNLEALMDRRGNDLPEPMLGKKMLQQQDIHGDVLVWKYSTVVNCVIHGDVTVYGHDVTILANVVHGRLSVPSEEG